MKSSIQSEVRSYLQESLSAIKKIQEICGTRNKTTKFKAIMSLLTLIEARMISSLNYAKSGGNLEFDAFFHQQLYNPIIEWLAEEIAK